MEPVTTMILTALVAGAVAATKDVAAQAIKDAYEGLKKLVVRRLGKKADVEGAMEGVEKRPDSEARKAVLAEELETTKAAEDAEIVDKAKALLALLETEGVQTGISYQATVTGSGAVAQGEGAVAAGEGGVAIGGDVDGGVHIGDREKDK
jgi:hypothetical protein